MAGPVLADDVIDTTQAVEQANPPQFNRDIRPILADKCFRCHGPDAAQRQANLRLDEPANTLADGRPLNSELFRRITTHTVSERMPPSDAGSSPLTDKEIDAIRLWIDDGATYQPHWAFIAPRRAPLPAVKQPQWARNPLDRFVLADLERHGIEPSPECDRATWLRRVSLDLIGLPPSLIELEAFLHDDSPTAYEKVVDRLLHSPHYGERLALDWLDGARYADTNGFFSDLERPIWRWRDWVINAFNRNQPFDQFTIEQLAGDLLPDATLEHKLATGFHRNHMVTNETGIIDEEYRVEYVADRVETTGTVWLGLTLGCARCHDHKYDPLSQREYYELFAFFNNVPESGLASGDPAPVLTVQTDDYLQEQALRKSRRMACEQKYEAFATQVMQELANWETKALTHLPQPSRDGLVAELRFENSLVNDTALSQPAFSQEPPKFDAGIRGQALKFDSPFYASFQDRRTDTDAQPQTTVRTVGTDNSHTSGPSYDGDEAWTISAWVSVEGASLACVLSKMEPGNDSRGLDITWVKGRLKIGLIHRRDENAIQIVTRTPTSPNRWHHIALTNDGSRSAAGLAVYIDGQPQEVRVVRDNLTASIANDRLWNIGRKDDGLGFTGRIDQLRFYRRVISATEIDQALYLGEEISGILELPADKRSTAQQDRLRDYFIRYHAAADVLAVWLDLLAAQQADAEWTAALPKSLVMEELPKPRETHLLERGQYDQPRAKVEANVPKLFATMQNNALTSDGPRNRLALARWLVHPDHPLTSRVIVNRYWTLLMGEGLVKTTNDFGLQGEPPSHPDLLDWLAVDFRESDWDVKRLLKQIVLSATYRQSAANRPEVLARDPENRWLARGPRFRLSGELLRDQALAASGLLSRQIGGPSVKPYQPPGLWEAVSYDGELTYEPGSGSSLFRRSLYTYWKRQAPPPSLLSFDSPTRETCTVKRPRTNTPLQALVLMNDPTYLEAARKLAEHVLQPALSREERLQLAFRLTLGRPPSANESASLLELEGRQRSVYQAQPLKARQLLSFGAATFEKADDKTHRNTYEPVMDNFHDMNELAAWTIVVSALLNLDEFINKP